MKLKIILLTAGIVGSAGISRAYADNLTACGAVLCLGGMAINASGGAGCASYLAAYFSIRAFKGGSFDPWKTLSQRGSFINQCTSADATTRNLVNGTYGTHEFGP